jgi:hypothetical protein
LKNHPSSIIATIILIAMVIFLAVDVGFSLYNPERLDSTLPVCTLNIISGNIRVQTKDSLTWEKAEDGMILEPGNRVRTAPDSHASLTFSQGTTTKLEPGTDLIIAKLEGNQDTHPDTVVLKHLSGKTWNQVTRLPDESYHFQIQTSSADIKVQGTLFATEVDESGKTLIQTTEGHVNVSAQGQEVQVYAGQQTEVEPGAPPSVPTPIPPAKNELVLTINKPAIGLVKDSSGSSTGYLPNGSPVNQISGSRSSPPEESRQTIRIREPNTGEYTIVLHGVADGQSSFSIEGFAEGESTFTRSESCNITAANELILNLHLDVIDGLLQGVTALNLEPPKGQTALAATTSEVAKTETESNASTQKRPDNDKETPSTSEEGEMSGQEATCFRPEDTYKPNQWYVTISVIVLFAVVSLVVWRKH